jgi:hypothetical protein
MTRDRDRRLPSCAVFAERLEAMPALASADEIGAFVRREHTKRIGAIQRALALAADADDIAAVAQQLDAPLSSENGDSASEASAPTFVREADLPHAPELEPDDAPLPFDLEAPAPRPPVSMPTPRGAPFPEAPPTTRLPHHVLIAAIAIIGACGLVAWLGLVRSVLALVLVVMVAIPIAWRMRAPR